MTVGVANPALLPFLALAALPVLVHLLFRRRTKVVVFPSLRLLRKVDPHLARRRRLHELVLLALRTAAVALAVLALARPSVGGAAGPASSDTVVVVDDSASTAVGGADGAWSRGVAAARAVLERMGPGDRGALHRVVAGPAAPAEGLSQDARALLRALEAAERTDARGSLAAALRRAGAALARGTSPDRRLVVTTDLDAAALDDPDLEAATRALPPGTRVVVVAATAPPAGNDVAVVRLAVGSGPVTVGRPVAVTVAVERRAGAASSVPVELVFGTDAPRRADVALSAAGTGETTFSVPPTVAGPTGLTASVPADDFAPDDRRHLVVVVRPRLEALLLDGALEEAGGASPLSGGALLALAADPTGDGTVSGVHVTRVRASDADAALVRTADLVLVHDAPDLPDAVAAAVLARHAEGAGLLVVAGPRAARAARAVPAPLDDALPARVVPPRAVEPPPAAALAVVAPADPTLVGLASEGRARLEGVVVKDAVEVATRADAVVLMEAGGRPVLLRGSGRPAHALLLATPLEPTSTAFALRPTFLAWLHGTLPLLARGGVERPACVAGDGTAPRPVVRAGLYDLERADAAFSVDADLAEATGRRATPAAWEARLPGATVVAPQEVEATLSRGAPRDLTGWLLVLACVALLSETALGNLARRRLSTATQAELSGRGAHAA